MKFIPTKLHGLLDYIVGLALIFAPRIFDFTDAGPAARVPQLLGAGAIVYSLFTRYEWGLLKVIPMRGHLTLDFVSGALLAASPWLFGFSDEVWAPHVVVGIFEIVAAVCTRSVPGDLPAHPMSHGRHTAANG